MSNSIEGKVVVITGASSGMGEAAARHLAAHGAAVVLGARRIERLEALAGEIMAAGGKAIAVATDVTRRAEVPADSFARVAAFAISQPDELDINEILFRPTSQEL